MTGQPDRLERRGSSEWGRLTHRVARGVIGLPGTFACGRKARMLAPPEQPERLCPRCFPAR